jgi:hypothetical protein
VLLDAPVGFGRRTEFAGWLEALAGLGAAGVVAPFAELSASAASDLLGLLIDNYLSGAAVGPALLQARAQLMRDLGNPLGLYFAHYGPTALRLLRREADYAQAA